MMRRLTYPKPQVIYHLRFGPENHVFPGALDLMKLFYMFTVFSFHGLFVSKTKIYCAP